MKTNIIEVGLPTANLATVQPVFAQCLQETGDLLIGCQMHDDLTLLVVRLMGDNLRLHLMVLDPAFRNEQVDSFQIVSCYLFKIVFKHEQVEEIMRHFPLHMGESWFTAADAKDVAYLCLNKPQPRRDQTRWLTDETSIAQWTSEA